jgi:hypothetical protein
LKSRSLLLFFFHNMKRAQPWICSRIWKVSANFTLIQCYRKIDNSTKTHHTMLLTRNCFSAWKLTWIILRPLSALLLDLKKSCPRYISAQKISTLFWCTGWAWNWQILFRFASKFKAVPVSYYEKKIIINFATSIYIHFITQC